MDWLYSPRVETEQFEAISEKVRKLLNSLMDDLFREHVQENSERMVARSIKACPTLLSEKVRQFNIYHRKIPGVNYIVRCPPPSLGTVVLASVGNARDRQ